VPRPPNEKPGTISLFSMDCLSVAVPDGPLLRRAEHPQPPLSARRGGTGLVWAHSVFDQGTVNEGVLPDGTKHRYQGFNRPSSILVTEAFLIEDGKIRVENRLT
jgi:hypothetical protein